MKAQTIRLDDIYQTRKYAELFDARYATSNIAIRDSRGDQEIVAGDISIPYLIAFSAYKQLTLVQFGKDSRTDWFPDDPFTKA